jgi:hypothetical protein
LKGFEYTSTDFATISAKWLNKGASVFSTTKLGLLRLQFDKDYSVGYSVTFTSTNGGANCVKPLQFALNGIKEAFCLLQLTTATDEYVPKNYNLKVTKNG